MPIQSQGRYRFQRRVLANPGTAHEKNKTSEQASFALEKLIREQGC
jgi:hypothetical protein